MPLLLTTFHHALVTVHPFPNGNGRHARLATEILSKLLKAETPLWGDERELSKMTAVRASYLLALKSADQGNLKPLHLFMWKSKDAGTM